MARTKNNQQAIFDAAMALPEAQRLKLAEMLEETLPPDLDEYSDAEWFAELERRRADFKRGTAGAIPWSEVKKQTRKALWRK